MRKFIVCIMIIALLCTSFPIYATISFCDLSESHWAHENIINLAEKGILNGYEDGTFRPENMVTYGEFMKLVICTYVPTEKIIGRIEGEHWALGYVYTAELYGLLPGGTVQEEKLDTPINRINMAKLLAKIDAKATSEKYNKIKELDFIDIGDLPTEYVNYLDRLVNKGIILGNPDRTFKPENNLTRAEMVTILSRL